MDGHTIVLGGAPANYTLGLFENSRPDTAAGNSQQEQRPPTLLQTTPPTADDSLATSCLTVARVSR